MKKAKTLNAISIRNALSFLMVLILIGAAAGFYFGLQGLKEYALDVNHKIADANASAKNVDELSALKQSLADSETLVAKANALFATESTYQSLTLSSIQKYASDTGVSITDTVFDKALEDGGAPTAPGGGHTVTVTIASPVSYDRLVRFLDALEGNLPKLQITGIDLSRPTAGAGDEIMSEDVIITVSTR